MPTYSYICPSCGKHTEVIRSMSRYDPHEPCEHCGVPADRDFMGESRVHNPNFQKPIEMFSVAPETSAEYQALRKALPDVEFTPDLVPLAHNRTEKMQILRATGCEERS